MIQSRRCVGLIQHPQRRLCTHTYTFQITVYNGFRQRLTCAGHVVEPVTYYTEVLEGLNKKVRSYTHPRVPLPSAYQHNVRIHRSLKRNMPSEKVCRRTRHKHPHACTRMKQQHVHPFLYNKKLSILPPLCPHCAIGQ